MKQNIFLLALPLTLTLTLTLLSCKGGQHQAEIKAIDSLLIRLDSAEKVFLAIDSMKAGNLVKEINQNIGKVQETISDTLQKEEALLLSHYRSIRKPLKEFTIRRGSIVKELVITRRQLNDLKHDLDKGLISKDEVPKHFRQETELAGMLISSIDATAHAVNTQVAAFDSLNPLILEFVKGKQEEKPLK